MRRDPPLSRLRIAAALAATALLLAGCASNAAPAGTTATDTDTATDTATTLADGTFPVTISHVYGETTITSKPERIATVAWSNHEVPLALGVVPVGMSKATWGDDDGDGVLPWVEDKLEELGAETPVLFDETDGIPYEQVADTKPDVILAAYSGLTQEDYDTLSKIAPVIAYPDVAWGTSYQDTIAMNAQAIGLAASGQKLIDDLEGQVSDALAKYPALATSKVLFSYLDPSDLSTVGFYTSNDTRPGFLESIGLPTPNIVAEASKGSTEFYTSVSAERADDFSDVDVFVSYGEDDSIITALQADPLLSKIPAIAKGQVAILPTGPLSASANPSALSIPWGIDDYFALLAAPLNTQG